MLKTVKKVSSHPTCNKNVLEKFIGPTVFGFNHQSSFCYLPGQSQFRSFFLLSNGCLFNSTNRVLATSDNYHVPIEKANEMNYFWEDYTKKISFKRRCVNKVATLLNCKEKIATALVDEHPVLFLEDINNTWENIQLLIESGISKDTIKKNIWVLYFDHDDLKSRISTIQQWNVEGCELKDFLPLLRLSPLDFQRSLDTFDVEKSTIPYGNRIVYLANILQVPVPELAIRLVRHKYILWRNLDLILASINCYFEFGITGNDLMNDIWSLRYTEPVIRRRLKIVQENNLPQMKTWYVRCSEELFYNLLETYKLETSIMHPFKTREEFLAEKLKMDLSVIQSVVQRNEIFQKINIMKLAEMIDYLLEVGFKATDICSGCRIFYFSLETTMERINELKSLGVESLSISMLITDQNKYRKIVERFEYINSLKQKSNIQ